MERCHIISPNITERSKMVYFGSTIFKHCGLGRRDVTLQVSRKWLAAILVCTCDKLFENG